MNGLTVPGQASIGAPGVAAPRVAAIGQDGLDGQALASSPAAVTYEGASVTYQSAALAYP